MNTLKSLLGPMRVPFLMLTPACVAVGVGTAYWQTREINWLNILLVLIGAVSAHISVNVFNEYFDFKSGLDAKTQRTPFSGGSGTLPAHPEMEGAFLLLAWTTLTITAAIGAYFVWLQGWQLLPIGIFAGHLYQLVGLPTHFMSDSTGIGLWHFDGYGDTLRPDWHI